MSWTTEIDPNPRSVIDFVLTEIDEYDYDAVVSEHKGTTIGVPVSSSVTEANFDRFRQALVEPYWIAAERRDTYDEVKSDPAELVRCMIITDDRDGYLLAYDPSAKNFVLVDPSEGKFVTVGVRGDPVGCYLAM